MSTKPSHCTQDPSPWKDCTDTPLDKSDASLMLLGNSWTSNWQTGAGEIDDSALELLDGGVLGGVGTIERGPLLGMATEIRELRVSVEAIVGGTLVGDGLGVGGA